MIALFKAPKSAIGEARMGVGAIHSYFGSIRMVARIGFEAGA